MNKADKPLQQNSQTDLRFNSSAHGVASVNVDVEQSHPPPLMGVGAVDSAAAPEKSSSSSAAAEEEEAEAEADDWQSQPVGSSVGVHLRFGKPFYTRH